MNHIEAAWPPLSPLSRRRARLRGRPSGLKGRYRDRCATGGPPLTPESLRPPTRQRTGQPQGAARRPRGADHQQPRSNPYNQVSTVSGDCHTAQTAECLC
jgi:hypothetical protein